MSEQRKRALVRPIEVNNNSSLDKRVILVVKDSLDFVVPLAQVDQCCLICISRKGAQGVPWCGVECVFNYLARGPKCV